jgi:hypothetical protein
MTETNWCQFSQIQPAPSTEALWSTQGLPVASDPLEAESSKSQYMLERDQKSADMRDNYDLTRIIRKRTLSDDNN